MKGTRCLFFYIFIALVMITLVGGVAPAVAKKTIIFADLGWDSAQVHNRIAGIVVEKGLGYPIKFVQGETIMLNTALIQAKGGEAPNVNMETWTENWQELYDEGLAKGKDPKTKQSEPPMCRFQWGRFLSFEAVLEQITQKFTMFKPDGTPLRAEVNVTLKEVASTMAVDSIIFSKECDESDRCVCNFSNHEDRQSE